MPQPHPGEIFHLPHFADGGDAAIVSQGVLINAGGELGEASILVPPFFGEILGIEVILLPQATGADMHIDVITTYAAYNGGEAYNAHTETGDSRDIGATVTDQNLAHSVSDLVDVAAMVAGDLLTVQILYDAAAVATNLYYRGLRLWYK